MTRIFLAADSDILRPRLRMIIAEIPHIQIVGDLSDAQQIGLAPKLRNADILIVFFPKLGLSAMRLVSAARSANPGAILIALTTGFHDVDEDEWKTAGATYTFNLTTQLQQFIDCLSMYGRTGVVLDRRESNDEVQSKETNT